MNPLARFLRLDWHYALTAFISAFLLFQVQPLLSKYILPWFGGSPAVWTTCVLFFQVVLCVGYAYAHVLEHFFRPRLQKIGHLALIAAALLALPITPPDSWQPGSGEPSQSERVTAPNGQEDAAKDSTTGGGLEQPTGRILALLAVCVGLPYLVLSSTGPLVQAWFSRAFPDRSPYRLYAVSNAGSLLALISYPFVVEPALAVNSQAWWWSAGFALFCLLYAGAMFRTGQPRYVSEKMLAAANQNADSTLLPNWTRRLLWVLLPAFASMLLLATTNHVCQDVAAIPFLWVVPLSLYLISFIITFDHPRWYRRLPFALAAVAAVYLVVGMENIQVWSTLQALYELSMWALGWHVRSWYPSVGIREQVVVYFAALFLLCMICHGELFRLRPDPRYLTSFYLLISLGGALGGLFVSLIAPNLFVTYLEWKMGLLGGLLLAGALVFVSLWLRPKAGSSTWSVRSLLGAGGMLLTLLVLVDVAQLLKPRGLYTSTVLAQDRNFYGTLRVEKQKTGDPNTHNLTLYNGRIMHGVQLTGAGQRRWPTAYYWEQSGIGWVLSYYRRAGPWRLGAVGLGVGTLAAYAGDGEVLRFYEINPVVAQFAEEHFTFLSDARQAGATVDVVLGDGRLSLERELAKQPQAFDVLVLDAFSGDAIPNHLLTKEAFETYLAHLSDQGAIAVHVSNRHLNLAVVVEGLTRHFGWDVVHIESSAYPQRAAADAEWMVISRNADLLQSLLPHAAPRKDSSPTKLPLWTDQRHNLWEILR